LYESELKIVFQRHPAQPLLQLCDPLLRRRPSGRLWNGFAGLRRRTAPRPIQTRLPLFAVGITPAIKHAALDLELVAQRRHSLPVQDPSRHCNPKFHPENSGSCHSNLRSLQFVPIFSVSSLGSTPSLSPNKSRQLFIATCTLSGDIREFNPVVRRFEAVEKIAKALRDVGIGPDRYEYALELICNEPESSLEIDRNEAQKLGILQTDTTE
jgi:hypothetical protein